MLRTISKILVLQLLLTFSVVSVLTPAAKAAIIDTQTFVSAQESSLKTDLQKLLARKDVRAQLIQYGVNPDDADQRIAVLTDAEMMQLQGQIAALPTGAGTGLEVLGIVFLVLLVLELVGVIDVFHKK